MKEIETAKVDDKQQPLCPQLVKAIAEANLRLRTRNVRLTIEDRKNWLHSRGLFPPKPYDTKRTEPHQQNLSLEYYISNENIPQSLRNIKQACKKSELIYASILRGEFDWKDHMKHTKKLQEFLAEKERAEQEKNKKTTFREVFKKFEEDFFKQSKAKDKDARWKILKRHLAYMELDEGFSLELFDSKCIEFMKDKTASVKGHIERAAQQLINFVEIVGLN